MNIRSGKTRLVTNRKPRKWKRTTYITQNQIDQLEFLIYNNLPISDKLIDEKDSVDTEWFDQVMKPEEQYVELPYPNDKYLLTTFGRIFNIKSKKQLIPMNSVGNLYFQKYRFQDLFTNNGLIYSKSFIKECYLKYNWRTSGKW